MRRPWPNGGCCAKKKTKTNTLVAFRMQDFSFTPTRGLKRKDRCTEVHFTFIAYYITLQRSYKKQIGLFELQQWPFLTKLSN